MNDANDPEPHRAEAGPSAGTSTTAATTLDVERAVAEAFPVTDRKAWIAVLGIAVIFLGGFVWLIFGQAPQTVRALGIIVPERGFVDVGRDVDGTLTELHVSPGDSVLEGDVVAQISGRSGLVDLTAPTDGVIATILERIGAPTFPGEPILTMSADSDAEIAVAFVPAQAGSAVTAGMEALVGIGKYPESQFGTLRGTVVAVSTLPATEERINLLVGGNQALVSHFAETGPVLEVRVRLERDPSAPSGYRWTIGQGPDGPIEAGALATVSVVVSHTSPLGRILG